MNESDDHLSGENPPDDARSNFVFVTCQLGAAATLKRELARLWPDMRLSYSRGSFLTFKLPDTMNPDPGFALRSVFARCYGLSLGRVEGIRPEQKAGAEQGIANEQGTDLDQETGIEQGTDTEQGTSIEQQAAELWRLAGQREFDALHVWQPDSAKPGHLGFEPGPTPLSRAVEAAIRRAAPQGALPTEDEPPPPCGSEADAQTGAADADAAETGAADADVSESDAVDPNLVDSEIAPSDATDSDTTDSTADETTATTRPGVASTRPVRRNAQVLDCIVLDEHEWWLGYHRAVSRPSRWPGGVRTIARPAEMISYAYLKMQEALRWSRLPVRAGQRCAELGCAPGGAAQALLEHGLEVLGIDPAEVDPRLVEDPGFTHLQMRVRDVRRRTFRKIKWLFSDMNVAPRYALDAVEGVVLYPQVQLRGMLLTLKLPRWSVADDLEEYLGRIRGWGFEHVVARQLPHFRQEVCVAAMRKRPQRNRRRKHERRTSAQAITPASDVGSDA